MEKNSKAGKQKEISYIHWTTEMDYALSKALLEQQNLKHKGANGWKGPAFIAAITALWDECQVHVSKEKIATRLRTWSKHYQDISAMLDTNGFGWDWERHVVKVDSEQVLAEAPNSGGSHFLVNDRNRYKSMLIRTRSSIWMIGVFIITVYLGHLFIWALVVVIQLFMANELFNLLRRANENRKLPGFRNLNWYFFFTAMLFTYGRFLSQHLVNTITNKMLYQLVSWIVKYQMFICYSLYIAGFVWFIVTLKKRMYKYQFSQYAWTHMILLMVFAQSSFTVANIFEGMFWFLLPASLIIFNDIAAYFCGFFGGKTPLIKLSPKKTWEGFIGAFVITILSAFLLANVFGRFLWLTCPRKDLSIGWLSCDPGPMFKPEMYSLPRWVPPWFPWKEIPIRPVQWHAVVLGLFASIIAPFGGFFASGFKRAFKLKDFGDSIPGHGGFTDRMDCQMVMAVFAYIYYQSFVMSQNLSIEVILNQILRNLSREEQQLLYMQLGKIFEERLPVPR